MNRKNHAIEQLNAHGVPMGQDFHQLNSRTVESILAAAKAHGYRKPRQANGSTARCFYEYANR